ncbi:MAG: hypothetical protein ACK5L5_09890 [Bacteroidales bacterium]
MDKKIFHITHEGITQKSSSIPIVDTDREFSEGNGGSNNIWIADDKKSLAQVRHEFINVGETIVQIKRSTTAKVTDDGLIAVSQFKQEISSRGEEVWYYKNSCATFKGAICEAQEAFPDVDLSEISCPITSIYNYETGVIKRPEGYSPLKWETINEYDGEKEGKPTKWENWADATQTALDVVGVIPALGEIADCVNGVISLARGNYADAALSFATMIPVVGTAATVAKQASKARRALEKTVKAAKEAGNYIENSQNTTKGVYDLIVKNGEDVKAYVGQSDNYFRRLKQHFTKGDLKTQTLQNGSVIHKMPSSTKFEREMYEQFVILRKYKGQINPDKSPFAKLLNKVNPVGGQFDLNTDAGRKLFEEQAEKIAQKYNLPIKFAPLNF